MGALHGPGLDAIVRFFVTRAMQMRWHRSRHEKWRICTTKKRFVCVWQQGIYDIVARQQSVEIYSTIISISYQFVAYMRIFTSSKQCENARRNSFAEWRWNWLHVIFDTTLLSLQSLITSISTLNAVDKSLAHIVLWRDWVQMRPFWYPNDSTQVLWTSWNM